VWRREKKSKEEPEEASWENAKMATKLNESRFTIYRRRCRRVKIFAFKNYSNIWLAFVFFRGREMQNRKNYGEIQQRNIRNYTNGGLE
jgi:hypothetical protein